MTKKGIKISKFLENKIKISRLRTNPRRNEELIVRFLKINGKAYRNQIARELKIIPNTVRDTLRRLIKKQKIQFCGKYKFQRKFYVAINT